MEKSAVKKKVIKNILKLKEKSKKRALTLSPVCSLLPCLPGLKFSLSEMSEAGDYKYRNTS